MKYLVLLLVLAAGACAPYVATSTGRVNVGGALAVDVQRPWNKLQQNNLSDTVEIWTSEGSSLDMLGFAGGVTDGKPLFGKMTYEDQRSPPVFRKDMTPTDIAELFEASLSRAVGGAPVQITGMMPTTLAGKSGFRFDYSFVPRSDDLERKGLAVGASVAGRLYLIFFHGSRIYHYEKFRDEVERMIASASVPA